jgi:lysozyme family protein
MSGMTAASWIMAGIAAAGTAASIYQGDQQRSAANKARTQAQQAATQQADQAQQDENRANQKQPDANALLSAAQQAGQQGASGTMLTGASGVDSSLLPLGRNTLLGQ